jgi:8-oxo-dGTP pyrophosphatase MutT (NUDIX family)
MKDQLRLAGCIIPNSDHKVLLLHRNTPKRTQWEVPGGKIDEIVDGAIVRSGHSAMDTVLREIKEEVSVDIRIIRELGAKEFNEDAFTMHYTWFLGVITAGAPAIGEPDKYDDLRYFSQNQLQAMRPQLSGNTQNFLDAWVAGEFALELA